MGCIASSDNKSNEHDDDKKHGQAQVLPVGAGDACDHSSTVNVYGAKGSGKSSLVARVGDGEFLGDECPSTVSTASRKVRVNSALAVSLSLVDANLDDFEETASQVISTADAHVVCVDLSSVSGGDEARQLAKHVAQLHNSVLRYNKASSVTLIAACKSDAAPDDARQLLADALGEHGLDAPRELYLGIVACSAKNGHGVDQLLIDTATRLYEK
jgi:GTPase SAR1 family protein